MGEISSHRKVLKEHANPENGQGFAPRRCRAIGSLGCLFASRYHHVTVSDQQEDEAEIVAGEARRHVTEVEGVSRAQGEPTPEPADSVSRRTSGSSRAPRGPRPASSRHREPRIVQTVEHFETSSPMGTEPKTLHPTQTTGHKNRYSGLFTCPH